MAFSSTQRFCAASMLHAVANKFSAGRTLTPQERADRYVSRMPIAVVGPPRGGHPSDRGADDR